MKVTPAAEGRFLNLFDLLEDRSSVRRFSPDFVPLPLFSSLLWSVYGFTSEGRRVVPSAGAIYPMRVYASVKRVEGLAPGLYLYLPREAELLPVSQREASRELASCCFGGGRHVMESAFCLVLVALYGAICEVYGERGVLYAHQESGHMAQNAYLAAAALGLGVVAVGAFDERRARSALGLSERDAEALYLLPAGFPSR